ncbi:1-aminocyclopropane-1-carboxylate deaminase/D-cysteine desulfhydrase [Saccharopolyspora phatthalungensis]|uniref:1-aminocyclopropane-1-carboxylate deaminase n=1 Tax=Saccharopolyspora phatthalungensis TaxID=664693 RepID=A0A840QGG1_9PSEU|nr:pyridoxal-phosphate dependent enzyme [Saccharopolyspora phatthalungensis]MBB5159566.1 1-aminocyclopropane-1-carboxylate deaminase [Saccharopolyspora phatthalungensis]
MAGISDFAVQVPSPLVELRDMALDRHDIRLYLKRDDLIHPDIPGNKWRKLKYNIASAKEQNATSLLTFGGAYSNHIRATAAAGHYIGFRTIGIIRGEEHLPLNPSLDYAVSLGMHLSYLDRASYRTKTSPAILNQLHDMFGEFYLIPEGGSNELALAGCKELPQEIDINFDTICCACGTGGTLAGIAAGLRPGQQALGFSVLKGGDFLRNDVSDLQRRTFGEDTGNWSIACDFHMGGYARRNRELDDFIESFERRHGFRLDWVYVAKMMYGIFSMIEQGKFPQGTTLIAVVTGERQPLDV